MKFILFERTFQIMMNIYLQLFPILYMILGTFIWTVLTSTLDRSEMRI